MHSVHLLAKDPCVCEKPEVRGGECRDGQCLVLLSCSLVYSVQKSQQSCLLVSTAHVFAVPVWLPLGKSICSAVGKNHRQALLVS